MTRRLARGGAAFLAALVATSASLALGPIAFAADEGTASPLTLTMTQLPVHEVTPDGFLTVSGDVFNSGAATQREVSIVVSVTPKELTSGDALDSWAAGGLDANRGKDVGYSSVGAGRFVIGEQSASATVTVAASALPVKARSWGVYGVAITLMQGDTAIAQHRSFMVWVDTDVPVSPVSVVTTLDGTVARVDALMSASNVPEVAVLFDPTDIASALDNGESTVDLAGREAYTLAASNPDLASLAHALDSTLLQHAIRVGNEFALPSRHNSWIGLVPDADEASLTLAAQQGALAVLVTSSVEANESLLPAYAGRVAPGIGTFIAGDAPDSPSVAVLLPEQRLSYALSQTSAEDVGGPARMLAESALVAAHNTSREHILVAATGSWKLGGEGVHPSLTALLNSPWMDAAPLADLLALRGTDDTDFVQVAPLVVREDEIDPIEVRDLAAAVRRLAVFDIIVSEPRPLVDPLVTDALASIAVGGRNDVERRADAIATVVDDVSELRSKVSIGTSSEINFISHVGDLPVTVRNDLDVPVTVRVVVSVSSPIVTVKEQPIVTVEPATELQVLIPAEAVSSGNVDLSVQLQAVDGRNVATTVPITLRVRPDWDDALTLIVAAAFALLLVSGLIRTIRRGRRDTREAPADPDTADV